MQCVQVLTIRSAVATEVILYCRRTTYLLPAPTSGTILIEEHDCVSRARVSELSDAVVEIACQYPFAFSSCALA